MHIIKEHFGTLADGTQVDLFTLKNHHGLTARITNYGGIIVSLLAPDRAGNRGDVVLGFDTLEGYIDQSPYFGCIVGRYANRIAGGRFTLNGVPYALARNNGGNALHGGVKGFDKVVWSAGEIRRDGAVGLILEYTSVDGEEGYPGNLRVTVVYTLTADNALNIEYTGSTDRPTVVNLTNHTYFNLAGSGDILGHKLMIAAERFTPVDDAQIPTGELRDVAGTPFDFRRPEEVGARIEAYDAQLRIGGGYDHNFVLDNLRGEQVLAARVEEPSTGRILDVFTTEPGVQFYSGNFLDGSLTGKRGAVYDRHAGFCLEAQHYPDSPNQPRFPSTVLRPEEEYRQTTRFKFSTDT